MATPKKETLALEIPRLDVQLLEVTIVGDSPLIVHAWSVKAKREMLDKQMKKAKAAKAAKDPNQDFADSMYRLDDGGYGFPTRGLKAAAVEAAMSVSGITKAAARRAFHVLGEDVDVEGAFSGTRMRENLARIEGSAPRMREDMVRVGMGTADLRYRAEFAPWFARVLVRFNAAMLSPEQILNLFNVAGFSTGIGEWRPERDGQNGMFHVGAEGEIDKILAEAADLARAA